MCLENYNKKCIDCIHNEVCSLQYNNICPYTRVNELVHNCANYLCKNDVVQKPPQNWFDKLGDTVYLIYQDEIIDVLLLNFDIAKDGFYLQLMSEDKIFPYREPIAEYDTEPTDWCTNIISIPICEINKTVFLTYSNAENLIKEQY